MKRTTYIFIGLFIAGIVLIAGGIFTMFIIRKCYLPKSDILLNNQPITTLELTHIHAVRLSATLVEKRGEEESGTQGVYLVPSGHFSVTAASPEHPGTLSFPESEYLQVSRHNDTLSLEVRIDLNELPDKYLCHSGIYLQNLEIALTLPPTISYISNVIGLPTKVKDLDLDSLCIQNVAELYLNDCRFRALKVHGERYYSYLEATDCDIEDFYPNLTNVEIKNLTDCTIGTAYLQGDGHCDFPTEGGKCKRIFWEPRDNESFLTINLQRKTVVTFD